MSTRARRLAAVPADPNAVRPATREETLPVGLLALVAGLIALSISALHGDMLLYGDAVAHLGIARRLVDTNAPGLMQLGGVWLPLPHLLMLPFVWKMEWWQNGMAGAWPSLICYVVGAMGMYRLARRLMPPRWALVATAFFGLNANLLYLSTTAMTEPLFLALLVWIVVLLLELLAAIQAVRSSVATSRLILLGVLIFAATMTRYDGWVLGAGVWSIAAWHVLHARELQRKLAPFFLLFTLLVAAGPISWLVYNHVYAHDWLDFMRGPYSAKEIDRRTSPPGSRHYFGWHDPAWSLMLYARTAQVDAAAWETGWLVAAMALWGGWQTVRGTTPRASLMLWLPLPFYVYSVSYGSVPIFIPQIYPNSFYNSRYGMEMLPAFAIFATITLAALLQRLGRAQALALRLAMPVALMLIVVNLFWMLHSVPLVLHEAMVNSIGRIALEEPLAQSIETFPRGATILMETSAHIGALQKAGFPLRQTIGPDDYYGWHRGMAVPADVASYVVASAGDAVSKAIAAHPEGLTELTIFCTTHQPCVRIYHSDRFQNGPHGSQPSISP